ncbi:MAG: hypothetical protein KAS71_01035 [Bacteroidales bacterium]|nr:hypothetical protein [Bacteroidales bacterium]
MVKISRRSFLKNSVRTASGIAVLGGNIPLLSSCVRQNKTLGNVKVFIPMPVQVVIDDVGWWSGEDGSKRQEPYRTGINRNHVPSDYQAIVDLGSSLGIRPQAAFVVCEWDKENTLKQLPTSTWMGKNWDNSRWVGHWLEEAAEIIRNNHNNFEITIHGVGHEYWEDGSFTRAEWTDSKGQMRPQDQIELHLEYFEKIMIQNNLGPLPKSFVPAAFRHSFGASEGRDISLAEILGKYGVNYINTPFSSIYNKERIQHEYFGFDSSVMTIDRGDDEFPWDIFPADPSAVRSGPTYGLHWPNMLHPDPERNHEVVKRWVEYLKPYNEKADMMLAPDSIAFQHQLGHHSLTLLSLKEDLIELDFTETDKMPGKISKGEFTIKIKTEEPQQFKSEDLVIKSQSLQKESEFLYVLNLKRKLDKKKVQISFV